MSEFDRYAQEYDELLKDPIRSRFTGGEEGFFARRQWMLLAENLEQRSRSRCEMSWLDVGCGRGDLLRHGKGRFGARRGAGTYPN